MNWPALVYPSSLIGYGRLILTIWAADLSRDPDVNLLLVVVLLGASRLLDPVDGIVARRLGQETRYGSALDLIVDLITHSVVWWLSGLGVAPVFVFLEWVAGLGILWTLVHRDHRWKPALTDLGPGWIQAYFRNNMRNVFCVYALLGHFFVPVAAFCRLSPAWIWPAVPGLLLYEAVTVYLVFSVFVLYRQS